VAIVLAERQVAVVVLDVVAAVAVALVVEALTAISAEVTIETPNRGAVVLVAETHLGDRPVQRRVLVDEFLAARQTYTTATFAGRDGPAEGAGPR